MNYSSFKIKNYEISGGRVSVFTDGAPVLHVTAVSPKTLEIHADPDGSGRRSRSYAVEALTESAAAAEEKDGYLLISAGEAAVRVYRDGIRLEFVSPDDGTLLCGGCEIGRDDSGAVFMSHKAAEREHFYGLGEDNDAYLGALERRGRTRDMVTGQKINVGRVTADIPVTFYMSTGNSQPYGIFTDNTFPMHYDMCSTDPEVCSQRASGGEMVFYFFAGDSFADILNEYTNLTGKPPMPPLWTQGYIQCRCSYWSWAQIDGILETLREKRIPVDCIVFDYDWAEYFNNYKWNKRWEGKSREKIAEYRKQGIHFMVSNSGPMLKKDSDTYQSALDAGVLARDTDGNTITCGHYGGDLIDFTNPAVKEWLRPQLERILDDGVESWWLDLTEPEGDPANTVYHDGERDRVHNIFSLVTTKTYTEITKNHCPDMRPFILTRTGTAGIQKYCTAIWSGDVYSDYKTFSAHIPEAMNTALSGIPMWTSDAGGFISSTNSETETRNIYKNDVARHASLYERWVQFACFSPVMRVHHAGESAPFAFGELVTDSAAHYIRLRYRLLPYIYSYAYRTHRTGEPLIRPLVYHYPDDENVYDLKDEFLFGEEILAAPVHEEHQCEREVYLPAGVWYDFDYGYRYEGGRTYTVYAPQNRIPVFVKSGAIIPMSGQIYNTSGLDRVTISACIWPDGFSRFTQYSDDGCTAAYETGGFTLTEITCEETVGEKTVIRTSQSNDLFPAKKIRLEIMVNAVPGTVTVNGKPLAPKDPVQQLDHCDNAYCWNDFSRTLTVTALTDGPENEIVVTARPDSLIRKPTETSEAVEIVGQCPYILPTSSVPCHMPFENFDRGGEGVAWHKEIPDNEDAVYREDAVGIEACDDVGCGYHVRNMNAGEWLEYTVNVLDKGMYTFRLRLRGSSGSSIRIEENGRTLTETGTSGERWHDVVTSPVELEAGEQTVRIAVTGGRIDGNWFRIQPAEELRQ